MDFKRWNEFLDLHILSDDIKKTDVGYIVFDDDLYDTEKLYLCGKIITWYSKKGK